MVKKPFLLPVGLAYYFPEEVSVSPLVTIGMPVFNAHGTVRLSIESIINQSFQDWELLVFDDGSVDGTPEVLESISDPRITYYIDGKNLGIANRMNEAIALAKGRYFARMDGDDISYPDRLEKQLKFLNENPWVDLVGSATLFFKNNGEAIGRQSVKTDHNIICGRIWDSIPVPHPTWMAKIEWIRRYKYSTLSQMSEDQDLLLRACNSSNFSCIPEVLLAYRQNSISLVKEFKSRLSFAFDLVRHYLGSKRYVMAYFAFMFQLFKVLIVGLASIVGAQRVMLYRRHGALSEKELLDWRLLYESFHGNNF